MIIQGRSLLSRREKLGNHGEAARGPMNDDATAFDLALKFDTAEIDDPRRRGVTQ
jgi:hypothetical protein